MERWSNSYSIYDNCDTGSNREEEAAQTIPIKEEPPEEDENENMVDVNNWVPTNGNGSGYQSGGNVKEKDDLSRRSETTSIGKNTIYSKEKSLQSTEDSAKPDVKPCLIDQVPSKNGPDLNAQMSIPTNFGYQIVASDGIVVGNQTGGLKEKSRQLTQDPAEPGVNPWPIDQKPSSSSSDELNLSAPVPVKKTKKKSPFWCETCSIQLTSFSTFRLHKSSKSHLTLTMGKLLGKETQVIQEENEKSCFHDKVAVATAIKIEPDKTEGVKTMSEDAEIDRVTGKSLADLERTRKDYILGNRKRSYQAMNTDTTVVKMDKEDESNSSDDEASSNASGDGEDGNFSGSEDSDDEFVPDEMGGHGLYKCSFCKMCYESNRVLQNHKNLYHQRIDPLLEDLSPVDFGSGRGGGLQYYVCPKIKCTKKFKTIEDLDDHLKLHDSFQCQFCEIVKDYAPNLAIHESVRHPNNSAGSQPGNERQCSRCTCAFVARKTLIRHFVESHLNLAVLKGCDICNSASMTEYSLGRHFSNYHNTDGMDPSEIQRCDQCPAYFRKHEQLNTHKNQQHYGKKCPECGKCFDRSEKLREHLKRIHPYIECEAKTTPCPCPICGAQVPVTEMLQHVKGHVGDHAVKCPRNLCEYVAAGTSELYRHMIYNQACKKATKDMFKELRTCVTCGFKAEMLRQLQNHLKQNHERGDTKEIKCPMIHCEAKFRVRQSVDFHLETHVVTPKVRAQNCKECSERIIVEKMEEHLKERHDAQEIFKCQHCEFKFVSRYALINHLYVHRRKGVSCDICNNGVKYSRHEELRKHYSTVHQVESKEFVCQFCSTTFSKESSLGFHQNTFHPHLNLALSVAKKKKRQYSYSCDICSNHYKTFRSENVLISHKIRCHGAEPFKCEHCPKTFAYRLLLSRHQKEHQTDESRSCICYYCGKEFGTLFALKQHQLIHTGERPFKCEICGQLFRWRAALWIHVKSHKEKGPAFKPRGPQTRVRKRKA